MDSPFVKLVSATARDIYCRDPLILPNLAGSGPMFCVSERLKLPIASSGVSNPDDKIHAPNENVRIDYFLKGVLHAAAIMDAFGQQGNR